MTARGSLPPKWRRGMYAQALTVACPYCHMPPGKQCRTWKGTPAVNPHDDRFPKEKVMTSTPIPNGLLTHIIGDLSRFSARMRSDGNKVGARILDGTVDDLLDRMEGEGAFEDRETVERCSEWLRSRGEGFADSDPQVEVIDLLRQIVESLEGIEGHVAPKSMRVVVQR